jgi:transcriptional regulator with XRE-family HTH domain
LSFKTDFNRIGPAIKELRIQKGITQKELCEGICDTSYLSKLEKGNVYALWDKLFLFAERLGVDINYFFEIANHSETEFVSGVRCRIQELLRNQDYSSLYRTIKTLKTNPSFSKNKRNTQYLIWHEGICAFNTTKNFDNAYTLLKQALDLTYTPPKYVTEQELSIMNAIGVICFETLQYELAIETYYSALNEIRHIPTPIDKKAEIKILYNLSKALGKMERFEESNNCCNKGIKVCKDSSYNYLLGQFYHLLGYNAFFLDNLLEAKENIERAIQFFTLYDDIDNLEKAKESLKEVEEKLKG